MKDYANKNNMDAGFGAVKEVQDAMTSLNAPGRQQARESEIQRLKSQGITEDSPAWTRAMQRLETGDMEAQNRALLAATGEYGNIFQRGLAQNEQGFGQGMDIANLTDRQRAMRLQEQATQGGFDEGRAGRATQEGIAGAQIGAQRDIAGAELASRNQNQLWSQAMEGARFGNEAQKQQWAQMLGGAEFANKAQDQGFGQSMEQQKLAEMLRGNRFGEEMGMAGLNAGQREQMLAEQQMLRQSPLDDLAKLQGVSPRDPAFQQFATAGSAGGVDYMGADKAAYDAAVAQANAKNAGKSSTASGLMSMAGTLGAAFI
jgi:hypothetical protein